MRPAVAALACALACAAWPAIAHGAAATADDVRSLALAAQRDAAALERLRAIDVVDGRPVRIADALRGADDAALRARLRALAQDGVAARGNAPPPAAAREQARDVLAERRFQRTKVPSPLRRVRERVGEALRSLGRPLESAFNWVAGWLPGGAILLWVLLAGAVVAAATLLAGRVARRDEAAGTRDGVTEEERLSAAQLRRQAERAERRGDLDEALRLRFRAGLVELDSREIIELRPALTDHELLGAVPSPTLAELVASFEAVAYGGRPAGEDDLRDAREGWPRVPEEAQRR